MTWPFAIIVTLMLASAVAAVSLRNLVHCALMLTVTFAGLAALYLQLDAQFVGFAQILIYVGAVAILIVFAILLTRGNEPSGKFSFSLNWLAGIGLGVTVFGLLSGAMLSSRALAGEVRPPPEATVHRIGTLLMGKFILPLEVIGLLLTAALIGAVLIAMREKEGQ
jgi:NADH:ubiquinone oxidoreductase subunit 6 (subunit J)